MPRAAQALDDQYVHGMYGAGRRGNDSRAPSVSGQRRALSRSPPPGGPVVSVYESGAPSRPVRSEVVHAIGDGQRYEDVHSLDVFEDMGLAALFQEQCPSWAAPTDFMATALTKLSQHHPGHREVLSWREGHALRGHGCHAGRSSCAYELSNRMGAIEYSLHRPIPH